MSQLSLQVMDFNRIPALTLPGLPDRANIAGENVSNEDAAQNKSAAELLNIEKLDIPAEAADAPVLALPGFEAERTFVTVVKEVLTRQEDNARAASAASLEQTFAALGHILTRRIPVLAREKFDSISRLAKLDKGEQGGYVLKFRDNNYMLDRIARECRNISGFTVGARPSWSATAFNGRGAGELEVRFTDYGLTQLYHEDFCERIKEYKEDLRRVFAQKAGGSVARVGYSLDDDGQSLHFYVYFKDQSGADNARNYLNNQRLAYSLAQGGAALHLAAPDADKLLGRSAAR
ncbi:MAG: RNA-binding protein [Candidatus Margulisbacteria bacterium]|jgi:hypothetical protein|nr:RNA-binding protein [Candidatus Margulisiibacteriota bacterium]